MLFLSVYRLSGELWKGVLAITSKINLLQLWLILDAQTGKKLGIPVLAGIGTNPGIGRYWQVGIEGALSLKNILLPQDLIYSYIFENAKSVSIFFSATVASD